MMAMCAAGPLPPDGADDEEELQQAEFERALGFIDDAVGGDAGDMGNVPGNSTEGGEGLAVEADNLPPEAPLAFGAAPGGHVQRDGAGNIILQLGEGTITWNAKKQDFIAVCHHPLHLPKGMCRKTRTARAGRRPEQGRPLGHLYAWLLSHFDHAEKQEHMTLCFPSFDARSSARHEMEGMGDIAQDLLGMERPCRPNEEPEPANLA